MNLQTKSIFQLQKLQRRGRLSVKVRDKKEPKFPGLKAAVVKEVKRRNIFGKARVDVLKRLNATRSRRHSEARALWEGFSYMMTLAN